MKELELEMRLRNNRMRQRRRELRLSAMKLADMLGMHYHTYLALETLHSSPLCKDGAEWRPSALRIAEFFGVLPEELWPDAVLAVSCPVVRRTIDAGDVLELMGGEVQDPERLLMEAEDLDRVREAVATLNPRERRIIRRRFWDDKTLSEVGSEFEGGLCVESMRQLQVQAERKLRKHLQKSEER